MLKLSPGYNDTPTVVKGALPANHDLGAPPVVRPDMPQREIHKMVNERTRAILTVGETVNMDWNGDLLFLNHENTPGKPCYTYFAAPWFFDERRRFMTAGVLADLQAGAQLLSVGSGPAHLERILNRGFGVKNITLSDISLHPKALESGLPIHQFDMMGAWPKFDHGFDYVIFPESFGVSFLPIHNSTYEIGKEVRYVDDDGLMTFPEVEAEAMLTTLSSAIRALKPRGKILMTPWLHDHEQRYLEPRLLNQTPSARIVSENEERDTFRYIQRVN